MTTRVSLPLDVQDSETFARNFLHEYNLHGMGGLSKRDVDVLVLYLLIEDGRYSLPRDIFRACRELKLSETKIRNLYQDVQLRYMQYDLDEAKRQFVELVGAGGFERTRAGYVTFIVRDPLLRQYFEEWVADADGFADSSFNKNLVTVSVGLLASVIEHLSVVDFNEVHGQFGSELAKLNDAPDMKSLTRLFAESFTKEAGATAGRLTVTGIATGLQLLILRASR